MRSQDGTPAVVLVEDYRERANLVDRIAEEASLFGVSLVVLHDPGEARERMPLLESASDEAAAILIDPGAAPAWGEWLEASREALPFWLRFLIVLIMARDLPVLDKHAPSFMSWAKALEIERLVIDPPIGADEVQEELRCLQEETGLSPTDYIEAWARGEITDTPEHAAWLNLAFAATGRSGQ